LWILKPSRKWTGASGALRELMIMSKTKDGERVEQINVQIPKHTKEKAKKELEHGGLTRVVRESLERVAHGEKTTERERVKDNLRELRDGRRNKVNKKQRLETEIEELNLKIERAENRLDELDDKKGQYEGMLSMLESEIYEQEARIWPAHGKVVNVAEKANCDPEDVIDDMLDRCPDAEDSIYRMDPYENDVDQI